MKNEQNNIKFYPAIAKKNHFEVTVEYIQCGTFKHTKKYSVCEGKTLVGVNAWDIENPNYVSQEVYDKMICKDSSMRLPLITETEFIWK